MKAEQGHLLEVVCRRIMDLDTPAYVKDSTLRYVAVNSAYAAFRGFDPADFIGRPLSAFEADEGRADIEEKERRALVFGSEEVAFCPGSAGKSRYSVDIERFLTDDESLYIFGTLHVVAETTALPRAMMPSDLAGLDPQSYGALIADTFNLVDVGVCIFDADNKLLYFNACLQQYYRHMIGEFEVGLDLCTIVGRVYDHDRQVDPSLRNDADDRAAYIEERLRSHSMPLFDNIGLIDGTRWLRTINKRLDNGFLLCLRIDVTDLKNQELSLRRSVDEASLYRSILEEMPVATFVRDSQHRMRFANKAYSLMMGLPAEELLQTTETELFGERGGKFYEENVRIISTGEVLEKEQELLSRDGRTFSVIKRITRSTTSSNEHFVVGSMMDVALMKAREQELIVARQSADAMRSDIETILMNLPVGILILNQDYDIEYLNDGLKTALDLPEDRPFTGRTMRDFIVYYFELGRYLTDEVDIDKIYRTRIATLNEIADGGPLEYKTPLGKSIVMTCRRLSDGRMMVTYADISALRENERVGRLLQDATKVMAQGLFVVEEGDILLSNDAAALMLNVPPDLIAVGRHWMDCFRYCAARGDFGANAGETYSLWEESIAQRKPISALFQTDNRVWVKMEATFGGGNHWMIVLNDLTSVKEREQELKTLLAKSEAADRAKSEFLANMSHEIRTPMNGVLGMAELLAKTNLESRQKTFVEIIVKSGNALLTIINDILDFSKIDAGEMSLKHVAFDPVDAIEDVATLLSSAAAEKDIEMMIRCSPNMPAMVSGDAGRFRQIITNLVGNAVKFTEKGHILIDVSSVAIDDTRVDMSIRIEDTGIGIPSEKLVSIFDKFSQVDTSSTRRHEGTGLGLAITTGLVSLFGGRLDVDSRVGEGTTFMLSLTLAVAHSPLVEKPAPISVRGARVLIIDDNEVNREILSEQLRHWHFDGFAVESGKAGLDLLDGAYAMDVVPDAIILDYHMPDMNGTETVNRIRRDPRFAEIPIVFLTSMDVTADQSAFDAMSVQAHLMKPARSNILRNTIIDVIRADRHRRHGRERAALTQVADNTPAHIPVSPLALPQATPVEAPAVVETKVPDVAVHYDILVAEDNEVNCIVFSQILQSTDMSFLIVNNGQQAVEAWQQHRPKVILMDVSMPVMNGHQASMMIRDIEVRERRHRTPIIAVTAHALDADHELCMAAGMDDYLPKPISPELLEAKVGRWLKPNASSRETR